PDGTPPPRSGSAEFSRGGGVLAGQQGVEPAVLAVAGPVGRARDSPVETRPGLDEPRCPPVGPPDGLLPRHRAPGPTHRALSGCCSHPRRRRYRPHRTDPARPLPLRTPTAFRVQNDLQHGLVSAVWSSPWYFAKIGRIQRPRSPPGHRFPTRSRSRPRGSL